MKTNKPSRKTSQLPPSFGALIRARREQLKLSISGLAEGSGIDRANLNRIELGKRRPPDLPFVLKLAEKLQLPRESRQFHEFIRKAEEERYAGRLQFPALASRLEDVAPADVITCRTSAEMVSKVTEKALLSHAEEIILRLPEDNTVTYRLR